MIHLEQSQKEIELTYMIRHQDKSPSHLVLPVTLTTGYRVFLSKFRILLLCDLRFSHKSIFPSLRNESTVSISKLTPLTMSRSTKHLPPKFLKNIEEVTYIVRGSQVIRGLDDLPFQVTVRAEKHRRLSFNIKDNFLNISEKEDEEDIENDDDDDKNNDGVGLFDDEDDEEQKDDKEQEDDEEEGEEHESGKRDHDAEDNDDITNKKARVDNGKDDDVHPSCAGFASDGKTCITRCPQPWRKQLANRPPSPAYSEHERRRLLTKCLEYYHGEIHDYETLAIYLSGHLTGRITFPDERPSTSLVTPDDSSAHPLPRSSSPYGPPCSPAYSPDEAIIIDPPETSKVAATTEE